MGISAIKLNKFLIDHGIKFKRDDKDFPIAKYSNWFNVVAVVKGEYEGYQCLITPEGQIKITRLFNKHNGK